MPPINDSEKLSNISRGHTWGGPAQREITVPSGSTILVKAPGVDKLLEAGAIDSVDTLSALVEEKHIKRVKGKKVQQDKPVAANAEIDVNSLLKKPGAMTQLNNLMDRVTEAMLLDPVVQRPVTRHEDGTETPLDYEDRVAGVIYTDTIPFEDRAHILSYAVGDLSKLERFREQSN
jgi:hypothetical protein